ncbi:MAG: hypothetical protein PHV82_16410 [Victivallaceae bacterium]|nr:hypothetical protein [Victivallaceae bacterium]
MEEYYVDKKAQSNGEHVIHVATCSCIDSVNDKENLGAFFSFQSAVQEAERRGYTANGCKICCLSCHTE